MLMMTACALIIKDRHLSRVHATRLLVDSAAYDDDDKSVDFGPQVGR